MATHILAKDLNLVLTDLPIVGLVQYVSGMSPALSQKILSVFFPSSKRYKMAVTILRLP